MVETTERVQRVMHELRPRRVEVLSIQDVAPRYRRITFGGDDLATFATAAPGDHIKFLISLDPDRAPQPPVRGEKGFAPPEGAPPQTMRDFTPRRFDASTKQLQIDFVLHESGPVSDWARAAQPGTQAIILGPRGSKVVQPLFDWFLMIGDETMLPSIARQIEELPAGMKLVAFVEVDGPENEQHVETVGDVQITWVHRNGAEPGSGSLLLDAVKAADLPQGEFFTWAGGEAGQLRLIRRHLLDDRGVPRELTSITGHWKCGERDFDHHAPLDTDE